MKSTSGSLVLNRRKRDARVLARFCTALANLITRLFVPLRRSHSRHACAARRPRAGSEFVATTNVQRPLGSQMGNRPFSREKRTDFGRHPSSENQPIPLPTSTYDSSTEHPEAVCF